jgi:D-alanyl-D-alanine carboxypeptidase
VVATRGWSVEPGFDRDFNPIAFLRRLSRGACAVHAPMIRAALIAISALILCAPRARAVVQASIVVDADSGRVIESHNTTEGTYPASLTKLMTLFLVFSQVRSGAFTLRSRLRVSPHAAAQAATRLGLRPGESLSVKEAILALVTESANDAAVVLAEAVGGTEAGFATMMNRAALRLGMKDTTFRNASGLPDPHQLTTARDMATLALALIHDFPDYYHFFSVRSFVFRGRVIKGHDRLLEKYAGADGMKTGFIRASGFNLVSSAQRHGCRLVGVVLGGASIGSRDRHMMHLLDLAFADTPRQAPSVQVAEASTAAGSSASPAAMTTGIVNASTSDDSDVEAPTIRRGIQVGGAFRHKSGARAAIRRASRRAPHELRGARSELTKIVRRHGAHSYNARFVGLDETEALRACKTLKRRKFVCRVLHWPAASKLETASSS